VKAGIQENRCGRDPRGLGSDSNRKGGAVIGGSNAHRIILANWWQISQGGECVRRVHRYERCSRYAFTSAEKERFLLRFGDISAQRRKSIELVGRSAIYRGIPEECCFSKYLDPLSSYPQTNTELRNRVSTFSPDRVFASIALQTTSIAHLGANRFATLKMPRPRRAEQEAIAEALSDADAFIDALEATHRQKRRLKQGGMQELLHRQEAPAGFQGGVETMGIERLLTGSSELRNKCSWRSASWRVADLPQNYRYR